MTDRVLTDKEIDVAMATQLKTPRDFARAVEAAVLAKVRQPIPVALSTSDATVGTTKFVPERRARERERAAWGEGRKSQERYRSYGLTLDEVLRERETLYPLPTVTRPRTVTLSDGTIATVENGCVAIRVQSRDGVFTKMQYYPAGRPIPVPSQSDFSILAYLVEHPTEEVPDDE